MSEETRQPGRSVVAPWGASAQASGGPEPNHFWSHYVVVGLLVAGAAILIRWLLDPLVGGNVRFVTLYGAAALSVWLGGWRAATLTVLAGFFLTQALFPAAHGMIDDPFTWAVRAFSCSMIILMGELMHRANLRARETLQEVLENRSALETEIEMRKKVEAELREANDRIRMVLDSMGERFFCLDAEGRINLLNKRAAEQLVSLGKDPAQVVGKVGWEEFISAEVLPDGHRAAEGSSAGGARQSSIEGAIRERTALTDEEYNPLLRQWVENRIFPLRNGGTAVFQRDITERKQIEEERARAEGRLARLYPLSVAVNRAQDVPSIYRAALDAVLGSLGADRAAILLYDSESSRTGTPVMRFKASRGLSEAYQRAVEGHSPWKLGDPDPQPVCLTNLAQGASALALDPALKRVIEAEGIGALAFIPMLFHGRLLGKFVVYFNQPHLFSDEELGLAQAIAGHVSFAMERKSAEIALRESEARLRSALDATKLGVWEWEIEQNKLTWSDRLFEFHGVAPADFAGDGEAFLKLVHPDDKARVQEAVQNALKAGGPYELEFRTVLPDGTIRWFKTSARVIFDVLPDGHRRAVRMLGGTFDLTERKELEEMLQWQTRHLDQLVHERTAELNESIAELESVSYTIAHDLRAPLRAMQSFARFLELECGPNLGPEGQDYTRRIITAALRMDQLIKDVLTYSRVAPTELELVPVDMHKLLFGILESYPAFQKSDALISIEGELPPVMGNDALLTQCFSNLLGNAVKFVAPGVKPCVRIRCAVPGPSEAAPDSHIRVWFEDNGIGIPKGGQERIFGVFQRLSQKYEGTGIGLAIVKKAVERMGGRVGVESELGQGSRFWIELRQVAADPNALGPALDQPVLSGGWKQPGAQRRDPSIRRPTDPVFRVPDSPGEHGVPITDNTFDESAAI